MRIALQSGIPMREIPADARAGANWRMIRTEAEAHAVETEWLRTRFGEGEPMSPGQAIARQGVVSFGSSLLHAGNASNALSAAVLVVLAISGGLAWFGTLSVAFLFASLGAILVEASRLIRSAERQALGQLPPAIPRAHVLGWVIDATFGLLILASVPRLFGESLLSWMFPPTMLMMLLALVPRVVSGPATRLAGDRALLGVVLAFAAGFGQVEPIVEVLAVALVILGMALPLRRKG
ncbi:hypothetical protein [Novosphingobium sp. PhB165]|uniref:hypothetical protein n=1 Tax=Novosphingobium sp. PhB165 TaxID=2485105 RepID=UPI001FB1BF91|nr:hypothetical protein [Novosphingobium sp. PhB165]